MEIFIKKNDRHLIPFSIECETEHRQFHILLLGQNREAERSTCQTGFKGAEVGHTT